MAKSKRPRKPLGDQYKRGYSNGVQAAVEAVLDDLQDHGRITADDYDEDGAGKYCIGCMLSREHFPRLAHRWEFAAGVKHGPEGTMTP